MRAQLPSDRHEAGPCPAAPWTLALDVGPIHTTAAARRADGSVRPLALAAGFPGMPSGVFVARDGLLTGSEAVAAGRQAPERYVAAPTWWLGGVGIPVGGLIVPPVDLVAAVLRDAAAGAAHWGAGPPAQVVLTHPAYWDRVRTGELAEAARRAGLGPVRLVPAPVAAAAWLLRSARPPAGGRVAVLDVAACSCDLALLRADPGAPGGTVVEAAAAVVAGPPTRAAVLAAGMPRTPDPRVLERAVGQLRAAIDDKAGPAAPVPLCLTGELSVDPDLRRRVGAALGTDLLFDDDPQPVTVSGALCLDPEPEVGAAAARGRRPRHRWAAALAAAAVLVVVAGAVWALQRERPVPPAGDPVVVTATGGTPTGPTAPSSRPSVGPLPPFEMVSTFPDLRSVVLTGTSRALSSCAAAAPVERPVRSGVATPRYIARCTPQADPDVEVYLLQYPDLRSAPRRVALDRARYPGGSGRWERNDVQMGPVATVRWSRDDPRPILLNAAFDRAPFAVEIYAADAETALRTLGTIDIRTAGR
ncbi:MAG TPA: hypothetical protein VNO83_03550 [Pseudonocardia sp.]|nr:hypothetical protein [Pseudonocardia sp.]